MELERGICTLCSDTSSKVLPRSEAEDICKFLPKILQENFLTESEFQKIKDSLKICALCCYKLETAQDTKEAIRKTKGGSKGKDCHFCSSDKTVIKVKSDSKFFSSRLEGFVKPTDFPVCVCSSCLFYFDSVFNIKAKLILKFPQLVAPKPSKAPARQNDTPKRKSQPVSPQSSAKKRKIFDDCFTYLQPLCKNKYYVAEKLKKDKKIYRKIAYVNLEDAKNVKETPRTRPVIKIKLKKHKPKRSEKASSKSAKEEDEEDEDEDFSMHKRKKSEKTSSKSSKEEDEEDEDKDFSDDDYGGFSSAPFIQTGKSEEKENKARRLSNQSENNDEKKEKTEEENLNETPKAAATSANTVPKRRVSLFGEANDADSDYKEKETPSDSEEINKVVNKYIKDSTFDDDNKLDLLREVSEDSAKLDNKIEENGIEKPTTEEGADSKDEEKEKCNENNSEEATSEVGGASSPDQSEETTAENNDELSSPSKSNSSLYSSDAPVRKTPPGSDASDEESDSDESEKRGSREVDRDSLNGSEKKKKRVTFSDDIN